MAEQAINVQAIVDWLEAPGVAAATPESLIAALNQRLVATGISLARVAVFVRTLHPNAAGRAFFWRGAETPDKVEVDLAPHDWMNSQEHLSSPIHAITSTGQPIRRRLADADCPLDFSVLAALKRLLAPVGRIAEIMGLRRKAQNILEAYLGRHAGEKVLACTP